MSTIGLICLSVLAVHASALFSLLVVLRRRERARSAFTPRVAVLKPLKGLDEGIRENLESFFHLDYPDYELLFAVADPADPVVPVVRSLMARHPTVGSRLFVGGQDGSLTNPKVRSLVKLLDHVRSEFVVISDSNVRVDPGYLRGLMAPMADPGVGLVTNVIAGVGERTVGAMLEHMHLDCHIATAQAFCKVFGGFTSVIGKSMALRSSALRETGGLAPLADYLAEDYLLGRRLAASGYSVVLSADPVCNYNASTPLHSFLDRHYRWLSMRWRINPLSCVLELAAVPTPWLLAWLWAEPSRFAWPLGLLALFVLMEQCAAALVRGGRPLPLRSWLLKPVKDMGHVLVLVTALLNDRVNWRGQVLRLGWRTRITVLPPERREELPPFLFPMRMGDEWPRLRAPGVARGGVDTSSRP
jgi:ceramide glucosyltransferase